MNLSAEQIALTIGTSILVILFMIFMMRKLPRRIKTHHYVKKWRDIQKLCANQEDWCHAIVHADMLLNEVLSKKKVAGKTTGEMMVNVQDKFSDNEHIWNAHKLANLIRQDGTKQLKESDVKEALIAFGQSLRDLGAL